MKCVQVSCLSLAFLLAVFSLFNHPLRATNITNLETTYPKEYVRILHTILILSAPGCILEVQKYVCNKKSEQAGWAKELSVENSSHQNSQDDQKHPGPNSVQLLLLKHTKMMQ